MARENVTETISGALAAADYNTSSKQFYIMKKNTTDNQYALCDTDGEICIGILQNKPSASGNAAEVAVRGISKVVAGETLTAGDLFGTDSSGKAKKVESTNTGADVNDFYLGHVVEGAASDELATVYIGVPQGRVESA